MKGTTVNCQTLSRRLVLVLLVGPLCAIGLTACPSGQTVTIAPQPPVCPTSSLDEPPTCVQGDPVAPRAKQPSNDMPMNSMTAGALNANGPLLQHLKNAPLSSALFTSATLDPLLKGPEADELLKYVASCALDPCDSITVPAGAAPSGFPTSFPGELGLCGQRYRDSLDLEPIDRSTESSTIATARIWPIEPLWKNAKPSQGCLERVSACMLARVNSAGKKVTISMRGKGLKTLNRVPTATMLRENRGTPILSFKGCDTPCLWGDPVRRNCDWEPRHVGQCVAGEQVSLTLNAPAQARIRVCRGIHGCDDTNVGVPGAGGTTLGWTPLVQLPALPAYGGEMIAFAQGINTVQFECPANGPIVSSAKTGYYAVMLASPTPGGAPLPANLDVSTGPVAPPHAYPATEENVFTFREGAFYGDVFAPITLAPNTCPDTDIFAADQYVCVSRMWSDGAAMASDRFCAVPGSDCFANPVTGCDLVLAAPKSTTLGTKPPPWATKNVATDLSTAKLNSEVYDMCEGPGDRIWRHPYTTYLNHPCDLFPSLDACKPYLTKDVCAAFFGIDDCENNTIRPG